MIKRILNVVGWIGVALVFAAVAVTRVPALNKYEDYAKPLAIAGLICVLAYMASQWREIAQMFARRQARYGTLAATSVLVVLGILIAINYIGSRQNKRWDLTANKQFSLSDQSKNVVTKLDAPLQVLVFDQEPGIRALSGQAEGIPVPLEAGRREYVDPDKKPAVARQNQIQQYGTIVFNYKGRTERVTSDNEQDITNGIIKVVSGQQKKVYFTQGHGERDTAVVGSRRLLRRSPPRSAARTTPSTSWSSPSRAPCPTMRRWSSWPDRGPTSFHLKSTR
jgi:ABC-type uncharacterized transport system involved in gliding motility auxiliary subunit